jgi:hypothetical protein
MNNAWFDSSAENQRLNENVQSEKDNSETARSKESLLSSSTQCHVPARPGSLRFRPGWATVRIPVNRQLYIEQLEPHASENVYKTSADCSPSQFVINSDIAKNNIMRGTIDYQTPKCDLIVYFLC